MRILNKSKRFFFSWRAKRWEIGFKNNKDIIKRISVIELFCKSIKRFTTKEILLKLLF